VNDEAIDRIFTAMDKAFVPMGYSTFNEGTWRIAAWFEKLAKVISIMQDRNATRRWLRQSPEIDPVEMERLIKILGKMLFLIRRFAPMIAKRLPHDPGGRPSVSTAEMQKEICEEISTLHAKGVSIGTACTRLAARYGVSVRSIQRIWNKRKDIARPFA